MTRVSVYTSALAAFVAGTFSNSLALQPQRAFNDVGVW